MRDDSDQKKDGSILNDYNKMEEESCVDDVFFSLTYDLIKDTPEYIGTITTGTAGIPSGIGGTGRALVKKYFIMCPST